MIGRAAEDFGLRSVDVETGALGKALWLTDFVGPRAKQPRKLVLLNFFAVWCAPCIAELPALEALQTKYGSAGLQVLSINFRAEGESADEALEQTAALAKKSGVTYPVLFDRFTTRNQLHYVGPSAVLPCNVFVDARGQVVGRLQGKDVTRDELATRVRALLGEESP